MDPSVSEWLNLTLRWVHVVAGIYWIGSSFYFMWLDSHLEPASGGDGRVEGSLWMVHSGGFYRVEKRHLGAGEVPPNLHWFKWEAAFTWLSGFCLLVLVYYLGGIAADAGEGALSEGTLAAVGIGLLAVSWVVYDLLWSSPLAERPRLGAFVSFLLLVGLAYGLSRFFGPRASYIHVGAVLGTLMVANVWMRILPAQRQMIEATQAGRPRDARLGQRAKMRSVHNNYMTFPVLFIMISNHFPSTYGHPMNWLVLMLLALASAGVRHHMNLGSSRSRWLAVAGVATLVGLWLFTR